MAGAVVHPTRRASRATRRMTAAKPVLHGRNESQKNKILSIAEEEGVAQASYALKLLQSEGTTDDSPARAKDPVASGRMENAGIPRRRPR